MHKARFNLFFQFPTKAQRAYANPGNFIVRERIGHLLHYAGIILPVAFVNHYRVKVKAQPIMERAARQGYIDAIRKLAKMYTMGPYGAWPMQIDRTQAVYWYEQLSAKGVAEADLELGHLHSFRFDSTVYDLSKAKKWYRSASKKGIKKADRRLEDLKSHGKMAVFKH